MRNALRNTMAVLAVLFAATFVACGGSTAASSGDGDDGGGSGGNPIDTTAGAVFPTDLVVTLPYSSSTASASVAAGKALQDFDTEKDELQDMLGGTTASECSFTLNLFSPALISPTCYGPQIDYQNHPDGAGGESGQLPPGDLGIWNAAENGEACAAVKVNQLVDAVGAQVDSAVSIFASIACSLNVNEVELPAVGESLDLVDEFASILSENSIVGTVVTIASLARAADDDEGHAVYDFAFEGSVSDGELTIPVRLYLRHIPLDDDNATYKGKLSFVFEGEAHVDLEGSGENDTHAGSVLYHKSAANAMTLRLKEAQYRPAEGIADPLDLTTYDIDATNTYEEDSTNGWQNNLNYALFAIDPQNGTGSYAYAWSAGSGDSHTRVFNATVEAAEDGTKSGCAYYGYGPQAKLNVNLGTIDGMICNWAGPGNSHQTNQLVQRQCVIEDIAGQFITDTAADRGIKILYAPTNSCDYSGAAFQYASEAGTMTNDVPAPEAAFGNDLLSMDEMIFTMPTAPDDVY